MIAGLLLAAGTSTRFGSNKLLHPLADGTTIAGAAARNLRRATACSLAIVRPTDRTLAELLRAEGLQVVPCDRAAEGMGHSLAWGVAAAPQADGWLIALGDMPFIAPETIRDVARCLLAGAVIAAPSLNGMHGHPVGFHRRFYAELRALAGDAGARVLLGRYADQTTFVPCQDPGIHCDIDTPADLAGLAAR